MEALETVMCDVIKLRLKGRDKRRSGKGNSLKRDGFRHIFMTLHMTLSMASQYGGLMQVHLGSARSGGYGDCCPPVVDPYTFIALIAGMCFSPLYNTYIPTTDLGTARSGGGDCCPPVVDPYTFLALIAGRTWRSKTKFVLHIQASMQQLYVMSISMQHLQTTCI